MKSNPTHEVIGRLLNATRGTFRLRNYTSPENVDEESALGLQLLHDALLGQYKAILELHSVYDDTCLTYKMAARYPWAKKEISKRDHMRMVWFQYVNHCYLFEEKTKLFFGEYKNLSQQFGLAIDAKEASPWMNEIEKVIGVFIRARGETFHQWYQHHHAVHDFHLHELYSEMQPVEASEIQDLYREAKFFLRNDIKSGIEFMEVFFVRLVSHYIEILLEKTRVYELVFAKVVSGQSKLSIVRTKK